MSGPGVDLRLIIKRITGSVTAFIGMEVTRIFGVLKSGATADIAFRRLAYQREASATDAAAESAAALPTG
jgi:hypothetical protein